MNVLLLCAVGAGDSLGQDPGLPGILAPHLHPGQGEPGGPVREPAGEAAGPGPSQGGKAEII